MKWQTITILVLCAFFPLKMHAAAIAPSTIDLTGERGKVTNGAFTVLNTQGQDQTYFIGLMPFGASGETGEPRFMQKDQSAPISKWITFSEDQLIIPARSKAEVTFRVTVPADAEAGTYQMGITVATTPSEVVATNGAVIEAKTASLLFFMSLSMT